MAYIHYLKVFLSGINEAKIYKITEKEIDRFERNLSLMGTDAPSPEFFVFDTTDGWRVGINLSMVQAAHFLWEPAVLPEDMTCSDGPITVKLTGRPPLEFASSTPEEVASSFLILEGGADMGRFISFVDEDGERVFIATKELIYIETPFILADEGYAILEEDI